ncbi:MAG: hypothetical protein IJB11_03350 [Oscillospiraceae bacterium]|nr:hypothetical protein [Oscillospiraceae bacterium]
MPEREIAEAVVDLLRTKNLSIAGAMKACDMAKELLQREPLAKINVATQGKCAATNGGD